MFFLNNPWKVNNVITYEHKRKWGRKEKEVIWLPHLMRIKVTQSKWPSLCTHSRYKPKKNFLILSELRKMLIGMYGQTNRWKHALDSSFLELVLYLGPRILLIIPLCVKIESSFLWGNSNDLVEFELPFEKKILRAWEYFVIVCHNLNL